MAEREVNAKAEMRARATRSTSTVRAAATPSDRVATETCPPPGPSARMTRRELLRGLGASAIVALAGCLPIGGEDVPVPSQPPTAAPDATAAALAEVTQPDCVITPRQTEGPFYFDVGQVRRDITEGKQGTPLLVDAPISGGGFVRADSRRCRGHLAHRRVRPVFRLSWTGRRWHRHVGRDLLTRDASHRR